MHGGVGLKQSPANFNFVIQSKYDQTSNDCDNAISRVNKPRAPKARADHSGWNPNFRSFDTVMESTDILMSRLL